MASFARFQSTVLEVRDITPTVKHFVLSVPDDFMFIAGQYVSALLQKPDGTPVRRPYSIASSPLLKGKIELCINKVNGGFGSNYFHDLKAGDTLKMIGPFGHFKIADPSQELVFVATGTGVAPLRSMIHTLLQTGAEQPIKLLAGYRYNKEELYHDEMVALAKKHHHFFYIPTLSQPQDPLYLGETGRVQLLIQKHVLPTFKGHFYLCGLKDMIDSTVELLEERGYTKDHILFEKYN